MAIDPTPFLSTIAGASSGLVAIVGGLLVARFVSLDSEQQGAQRLLDDAEARLAIAQQRVQDAADRSLRWDVQVFSNNRDVVEAILESVTDLAELRRQSGQTRLTDKQLTRLVEEIRRELARAHQVLEAIVPASEDVEHASWEDFRRSTPDLPETNWELAWESVFYRVCERRAADRKAAAERARAAERAKRARSASFPAFALPEISLPEDPMFSPRLLAGLKPIDRATLARRRDELMAAHERAQQQVEDLEGEAQRLRRARDAIVRPQGLGWGLGILGYFAVVGVVVPILLLSRGAKDLTPLMGTLVFYGFCSGLVALLAYMAVLALRLSRRRSATTKHERG